MAKHVKMPRSDTPRRNELELFMECEEEELTPSQREANNKAQTDYKSALQKIENAKTVNVPPRSGPARKSVAVVASVSSTKTKKRENEDVIVIEDDPVIVSRSPAKRGRPLTQTSIFATSTYSNVLIQPSSSLLQTLASTTSNLSLVSSNMSNMMPMAPRASSGMIFPSNAPSFLTLPTTLQSNSIGLTMGKKVLLAMPVSAGGKQTLVLPAGIKQLQVINALQSVNSISGTQSMIQKAPEPAILVTSGSKSVPTTPALSTQASNASFSANQDLPKPRGRGRPRKVYAPCPDDDVQIVELLQVVQPTKVGRPPKKFERQLSGGSKAVSHLESTVSPVKPVAAVQTVSPKPKGRVGRPRKSVTPVGRPRKAVVPPSDDDEVQIVEPMTIQPQPVKVVKPASKPPAPVAPTVVSGTSGLGVRRSVTSDDETLSSDAVQKKLRTFIGSRKLTRSAEASPAQAVVSGTFGFGVKRPNVSDEDTKSSESVQKKPRMASVGRRRQGKNADAGKPQSKNGDAGKPQSKNGDASKPGIKKKPEATDESEEKSSTWIPLDEYYYGKKEGDPTYREDKGEYRFKCWYCHKMLYNNLRLMLHMQGHIDNDKQQNLDLSDLTQCRHCYKQFDTPFEMQCHIEKVHQNNSNVLVCRICEKDHENQSLLQQHMKSFHQACEMPYSCKLCNYRSSIYSDVVDHFKKRHDSSQYILCLYCLKIFKVSFYKTAGWGMTQNYYQHIQKHQNKGNNKKCICCKLTFLTKQETDDHRTKDHMPNYRGIQSGQSSKKTVNRDKEQVLICIPEAPNVKLLNAPATSKVLEIRILRFQGVNRKHLCLECEKPMNTPYHYKNYVECTLCRFATSCNDTFASHMMIRHSGVESEVKTVSRKDAKMTKEMFCLCGFCTLYGSFMANHLVSCSKRTCYSSQPEMKYFEYDDEMEEFTPFEPYVEESEILRQESSSPDADVPSLFGVLGLVKKPRKYGQRHSKVSGPRSRPEVSAEDVVNGIIEDILDSVFPAEKAASDFISYLLDQVDKAIKPRGGRTRKKSQSVTALTDANVDSIPPELTGPRKWKTVKISDSSTPSKKAIFLGSEEDFRESKSVDAEELSVDVTGSDDAPVIEPMESDTALLTPTKVRPHVCDGEEGDVFWNMPDIEKMESSTEVEDSGDLEGNEIKIEDGGDLEGNETEDASGLEQELDLQPENAGGVKEAEEEEHDEDDEATSDDRIIIEKGEDSNLLIQLVNVSEDVQHATEATEVGIVLELDLKQPENAGGMEEAAEEECDEDDEAISDANIKIERREDSDLMIQLVNMSENVQHAAEATEFILEHELDLNQSENAGGVEEAEEEERCDEDDEAISENKIKMEMDLKQSENAGGVEVAEQEERNEDDEAISDDNTGIKIERGEDSNLLIQLVNVSENVQLEAKATEDGLEQEMDLNQPENAGGVEEAEEEERHEDDEAISGEKIKTERGEDSDLIIELVNNSEDIQLEAEATEDRLEQELDLKQPKNAGGMEETEEGGRNGDEDDGAISENNMEMDLRQPENAGGVEEAEEKELDEDDEAISDDNSKIERGEDSDLLIQLVKKSEDIQLEAEATEVELEQEMDLKQPKNADGVEEADEEECDVDEDNEAISNDNIKIERGEDSDLLIQLVNKSEDIQLEAEATEVEHAVNKHVEPDETDAENGEVVNNYQQPVSNPPSVEDDLGDAVVMESCVTSLEDVAGDEEHGREMDSTTEVREENLERGREISLGFNILDDECELDFPYKVDSNDGEASMSASLTDVVSGSVLHVHPEEDSSGKTEVTLATKCDSEANVDVIKLGVHNVEELLYKIEPESLDFDRDLDSCKEDHAVVDGDNCDMYNFDQQYENIGGEKCNADQESDSIKTDHIADQEDLPIDHKKCDYPLVDTELDASNIDQSGHDIDHEKNHDTELDTFDQEDCRIDKNEYQITEQEAHSTDQDNRDDQDMEQDPAGVGSFSNKDEDYSSDKDVESACSFNPDAHIAVDREDLKNELETSGVGDEGCFVDQEDNCHADNEDHPVVDPCPSVGLQDSLQNDKTLTSYRSQTESHDFKNLFNETDESNTVIPKLTERDGLGIDLLEKFMDTPNSIYLNENDSLASVKTTEGLQKCDGNEEAFDSQKSDIQDQRSQEKQAHGYSSSAGSEEKRGHGDSCTDRKESHSPQTSLPISPPVSGSDKSNRRDSHHSDSSHHNDRGYGSRDDRRSYNQKDHDRRDSSQRDYDHRDYDRRDHDRRDYDRRDHDRRDYDRRDSDRRHYEHNDQRPYDRSGSGYRYESHSHGNRRDRDDRYERHSDSRSGQSRNSGHGKSHDSSNSNRRPHHPH